MDVRYAENAGAKTCHAPYLRAPAHALYLRPVGNKEDGSLSPCPSGV